ncbi:unnamed protein product [Jaminaea pallidilutea]
MSTLQAASPAAGPPSTAAATATAAAAAAAVAAQSMVVTAAATVAAATTAASVVTPHLSTYSIVPPKSVVSPSASRSPPATSAFKSFNTFTPHITSQPLGDEANTAPHQSEAAIYPHLRSKSVSFATLAVRPSKQMTGVVMHQQQLQPLQRSRQSVSFTGVLGSRRAQLSLLAEQANLAAVGTSSLKVARASSLVMDEAVKAALVKATSEDSASADDGDATSGPSASAPETVDKAWQETLSADGFLSSASSLAQLFQTQEQSRKDWAGQALALQRRRWTMDPSSASSRDDIRAAATSSCKGKRPALDDEEEEKSRQEARIVEMDGDETMTQAQAQINEAARSTETTFKKRRTSEDEVNATTGVAVAPSVESDAAETLAITKGRALSNTNTPRPQLLVNVLTSFETLLDARQQACAGLAELARTADELSTFQSSASSASAVQRSRGVPPHTIADTAAIPPVLETSEEEPEESSFDEGAEDETCSSSGDNASPIDVKLAEQVDAAVRRRSG